MYIFEVNKFELQLRYYADFLTNDLRKCMNPPPIHLAMV